MRSCNEKALKEMQHHLNEVIPSEEHETLPAFCTQDLFTQYLSRRLRPPEGWTFKRQAEAENTILPKGSTYEVDKANLIIYVSEEWIRDPSCAPLYWSWDEVHSVLNAAVADASGKGWSLRKRRRRV